MATIKSSTEHLTLNADGAGKDIKFQANGVEKASIDSSGNFTSTSIDATKLSGALPAIDGSALTGVGKVLQVVFSEDSTRQTVATATYTDTGLSATITPSSTTSKILAMWSIQYYNGAGASGGGSTQLMRGATAVYTNATQYRNYIAADQRTSAEFKHLDSPATTSALTYKVQVGSYLGRSLNYNEIDNQTQLVLMEIGA